MIPEVSDRTIMNRKVCVFLSCSFDLSFNEGDVSYLYTYRTVLIPVLQIYSYTISPLSIDSVSVLFLQ